MPKALQSVNSTLILNTQLWNLTFATLAGSTSICSLERLNNLQATIFDFTRAHAA